MTTIGIVSPGAMGSALGRVWRAGGARVVATVDGRSERTVRLGGDLELLPDLSAVLAVADLVVSVGPPERANEFAVAIAAAARAVGARPLVVDVNAVAPATMGHVAELLGGAGCPVVDGSISGGPPHPDGPATTTLYLSGPAAVTVAAMAAPGLRVRVVGDRIGTASAVKMCTASVYKGFSGLLLQALRTARVNGVLDVVVADLTPEFAPVADAARSIASVASKSDRFPAEMREIARTQADAGAVGDLFEAFARVYESVHQTRLADHTPEAASMRTDLEEVLAELEQPSWNNEWHAPR